MRIQKYEYTFLSHCYYINRLMFVINNDLIIKTNNIIITGFLKLNKLYY